MPHCSEEIQDEAKKCRFCGEWLENKNDEQASAKIAPEAAASTEQKNTDEKFCESCGKAVKIKAELCPSCGVRQKGKKSKVAAFLLAWFLGGFGVHKFYLNRPGQGILYLLFFWTFIPAIIAFVEGIIYLATSDEDFARKYG